MPTDFLQLTTVLSGGQLLVIAFVLMELRALKEAANTLKAANVERDKKIASISEQLSNVMGRLGISSEQSL